MISFSDSNKILTWHISPALSPPPRIVSNGLLPVDRMGGSGAACEEYFAQIYNLVDGKPDKDSIQSEGQGSIVRSRIVSTCQPSRRESQGDQQFVQLEGRWVRLGWWLQFASTVPELFYPSQGSQMWGQSKGQTFLLKGKCWSSTSLVGMTNILKVEQAADNVSNGRSLFDDIISHLLNEGHVYNKFQMLSEALLFRNMLPWIPKSLDNFTNPRKTVLIMEHTPTSHM